MLNVCFDGRNEAQTKYYVHEKNQYYVLNTQNGHVEPLQDFIKAKKILQNNFAPLNQEPPEVILLVSQKFLKELTMDLQVKWSAISSTVNLISVQQFFETPTLKAEITDHELYEFERSGPRNLKIASKKSGDQFQLQSSSTFISILSYNLQKQKYVSHSIEIVGKHRMALGWDRSKESAGKNFQSIQQHYRRNENSVQKQGVDFSNYQHFPVNSDLINPNDQGNQQDDDGLLFCVNTFRNLQRIKDQSEASRQSSFTKLMNSQKRQHSKWKSRDQNSYQKWNLPPPTIPLSWVGQRPYVRQKQQPVALLFSAIILLVVLFVIYKIGVKQIVKELSKINDGKIEELEKKLNKHLPKNTDSSILSIRREQIVRQTSQYSIYRGRFLNHEVQVYTLHRHTVADLQGKLDALLKISSKGICKVHYYTVEDQTADQDSHIQEHQIETQPSINIIVEKNDSLLSEANIEETMKNKKPRESMKQLLNSLLLLAENLQFNKLPMQCIVVSDNQLKIDIIPSLLCQPQNTNKVPNNSHHQQEKSMKQQQQKLNIHQQQQKIIESQLQHVIPQSPTDCKKLRADIIAIFYFMATKGQQFKAQILSEEHLQHPRYNQPNQVPKDEEREYSDPEFVLRDFLDFIDSQDGSLTGVRLVMNISEHPYLWDSKRKMLFFTDFSNYVETHIDQQKLRKLESTARDLNVIRTPWVKELHPAFTRQMNTHRKYDYSSVRDLIRVVRNKVSHFHELPKDVKNLLGKNPEQFVLYFLWKFPKLLPFMYVYSVKKKWKLHAF